MTNDGILQGNIPRHCGVFFRTAVYWSNRKVYVISVIRAEILQTEKAKPNSHEKNVPKLLNATLYC